DAGTLVESCTRGALASGILKAADDVVATWQARAEYGYPTPSRDRDARLEALAPSLEERHIFSRGRFGAWRYEVGNMDHSYLQGIQAARRVLGLRSEPTLALPVEQATRRSA
ncbi:MAG: protoporphyrinogen/coproporphyrinogen oxidase, partial [Planctomycetota bacterium]